MICSPMVLSPGNYLVGSVKCERICLVCVGGLLVISLYRMQSSSSRADLLPPSVSLSQA